jgi:nicotinamidase-related amidase
MDKLLIIVDMQNDFIDGALANPAAQAIVPGIVDFVESWQGKIGVTLDTHQENYLETQEGKNLPVPHCIVDTYGHKLNQQIADVLTSMDNVSHVIMKPTFGFNDWEHYALDKDFDEAVLVGTCTDICVISNALAIKAAYPELKVTVIENLCAGLSSEKHAAAIEVMKSCQVNVV